MTKQRADGRMSGVVNGCSGDIKKHESYRFSLKTLPKKREEKKKDSDQFQRYIMQHHYACYYYKYFIICSTNKFQWVCVALSCNIMNDLECVCASGHRINSRRIEFSHVALLEFTESCRKTHIHAVYAGCCAAEKKEKKVQSQWLHDFYCPTRNC